MGDASSDLGDKLGDSGAVELTGQIMVVAIIILFLVVVFVFVLHIYAKWFFRRRQQGNNIAPTRRHSRLNFAPGHQGSAAMTTMRKGLEPSVLKSIPVIVFDSKEFKDGLECAVCLCDISEGEKARLLPKCNHGFHVDCIDMWFQSHSTCPLCRNPVSSQASSSSPESTIDIALGTPAEENSPNLPTNVLFWGNETQVSTLGHLEEVNQFPNTQIPTSSLSSSSSGSSAASSSLSSSAAGINRPEGMLVIDIPREINEEEESKSPMPRRLRSFKRLLSRDRRVTPSSPRDIDVEEGARVQR